MRCESCRDLLSAQLDGEDPGTDSVLAYAHLEECAACQSFANGLTDLHRAIRLRTPEPVPDLTDRVLERVETPNRFHPEWARYALAAVALLHIGLAVPELIFGSEPGASVQVARELGGWDTAVAVGFLYVVWRPDRAAGLLPFALALAGATAVTATLDVTTGSTRVLHEAPHLVTLAGVVLVAVLASTNWWSVRRATPEPTL